MNKPKNQFATLTENDRKHILELCSKQTYDEAANLLARPRVEGGLEIITSAPALCRFYTTTHQNSDHTLLAQYAAAANIRHEQDSNAFLGAIRANVEARVLESLRHGKALADMDKEFRFLKIIENLYLADARWRTADPKAARAAYQRHVDRCANAPEIDFVPVEELKASPDRLDALGAQSDFEQEIIQSRERQKREAEDRRQLLASFTRFNSSNASNPANSLRTEAPSSPSSRARVTLNTSTTPVIPHIPHNSTNPAASPGSASHNNGQPATKPVPYVSPTPKVGRNDPCPCGSGRKYKKCCSA